MAKLEPLRVGHVEAVLAFERGNREYFATLITDRGVAFFEQFAARFQDSLAEQDAGDSAVFVLVDGDGDVIGRFNLYGLEVGGRQGRLSELGAPPVHGIATAAVGELCKIALSLGLRTLTAATSHGNVASQRVLIEAGFERAVAADPLNSAASKGARYRRDLGAH